MSGGEEVGGWRKVERNSRDEYYAVGVSKEWGICEREGEKDRGRGEREEGGEWMRIGIRERRLEKRCGVDGVNGRGNWDFYLVGVGMKSVGGKMVDERWCGG